MMNKIMINSNSTVFKMINKVEDKMKISNNIYTLIAIIISLAIVPFVTFAQGGNNNAFLFDGAESQLYVEDGQAPNGSNADQDGFQYFNSSDSPEDEIITVQAWIYLMGDTPSDVEVPIVYRALQNGGTTFALYTKNNKVYFSVGDSDPVETPDFPAFRWTQLTGIYDGTNLKIYLNDDLSDENYEPDALTPYDPNDDGLGLFVGSPSLGQFMLLIDEVRIFDTALGENNINGSGGHGNPAEPFPNVLSQYLRGQWSFTKRGDGNGTNSNLLYDLSDYKNHLYITETIQILPSKNLPFIIVTSNLDDADSSAIDGTAISENGEVTLRSAIEHTNISPGLQTVFFYITEYSSVIEPLSSLPDVTDQVYLNGTSQAGYYDVPQMQVQVTGTYGGLTISGSGGESTVKGLSINNSSGFSLALQGTGSNNIIENKIAGINVSSPDNNISNNTFSNSSIGVEISDGAQGTVFSANTISENTVGIEFNTSSFSLSDSKRQ